MLLTLLANGIYCALDNYCLFGGKCILLEIAESTLNMSARLSDSKCGITSTLISVRCSSLACKKDN